MKLDGTMLDEAASHRETNTVLLHSCGEPRVVIFTETGREMVLQGLGGGEGAMEAAI